MLKNIHFVALHFFDVQDSKLYSKLKCTEEELEILSKKEK